MANHRGVLRDAAFDERIAPYFEDPHREEVPADEEDKTFARVPDWPGVYRIDKLNV
ncbi:MAG: hypothetical protein ACYTG0_08320 [Planctomycetota bacterium]